MDAPTRRLENLARYFRERREADLLLLGEALGYQGGHFSGIAMTSERMLLGKSTIRGFRPEMVFHGLVPHRTSRPEARKNGFTEPTATIVWGMLLEAEVDPRAFLIWNAVPWHPFKPEKGIEGAAEQ